MHLRPALLLPLAAILALCVYRVQVQLEDASARVPVAAPVNRQAAAPEAPKPRPARPPGHQILKVAGQVELRERPRGNAVAVVGSTTEFGSPRVLGVAAQRGRWLGVVTDEQPNGRLAWVDRRSAGLSTARTTISLHADLSERSVELRRGDRTLRTVKVAVGNATSPTPPGRYAVTDKIPGTRYGPYYGCCILALSGHQGNPPPGWTGGDRLAIHGTDNPATIGSPASAGCLRASDADLQKLMSVVPVGAPVFVSP